MAIEVIKPGLATTVQDAGWPGYYNVGIPLSGALDQYALRVANLLVGNRRPLGKLAGAGTRLPRAGHRRHCRRRSDPDDQWRRGRATSRLRSRRTIT